LAPSFYQSGRSWEPNGGVGDYSWGFVAENILVKAKVDLGCVCSSIGPFLQRKAHLNRPAITITFTFNVMVSMGDKAHLCIYLYYASSQKTFSS